MLASAVGGFELFHFGQGCGSAAPAVAREGAEMAA
jgi:hypothetical protein